MEMETVNFIYNMFNAVVCVFVGILVLLMFIKALERKGRSALLLLPLALWVSFLSSWVNIRNRWVFDIIVLDYDREEIYLSYIVFEKLLPLVCILLALLLIFKKDKPKMEELSYGS